MKNIDCKTFLRVLWLIPVVFLLVSCSSTPDMTGKWKEIGKTAMLEFSKDGTFKAVDNQGMAVSGKYTLLEDGQLHCEIFEEGRPVEIVNLKVSIKEDELTLTSPGHAGAEHYRKER
jgi:hypothetical protein